MAIIYKNGDLEVSMYTEYCHAYVTISERRKKMSNSFNRAEESVQARVQVCDLWSTAYLSIEYSVKHIT